ncbi:MAG: ABC transporter [Flavobacteriaceae bacterium]|nr:MAG: ABC transporter [Flavobacteriaceae bacterium]
MNPRKHWAVFINNQSNKEYFIQLLLKEHTPEGFKELEGLQGVLFSKLSLYKFIDDEERHDEKTITQDTEQSLKSMSSGEQKKALLQHLLQSNPDFLILDNPFDNLDTEFQKELKKLLKTVSNKTNIIQLISRKSDLLPFITQFTSLEGKSIAFHKKPSALVESNNNTPDYSNNTVPPPLHSYPYTEETLLTLKNISVSFDGKPVLKNIHWEIKPGEFWQLAGKNGSGKTTILSMITGDNSKGYGQELYLFGRKKGTGESIWDIKEKLGYVTPSMTDKFTGHHTLEHMIISGLNDSIGLYKRPSEIQLQLAKKWLQFIEMWDNRNTYFHDLSMGQKRLIMTVRAMVKHPLLLILDEPTAGLDDKSALLFTHLVNKIAHESTTAIVFVSHRKEPGLEPQFIYELQMSDKGSIGIVTKKHSTDKNIV